MLWEKLPTGRDLLLLPEAVRCWALTVLVREGRGKRPPPLEGLKEQMWPASWLWSLQAQCRDPAGYGAGERPLPAGNGPLLTVSSQGRDREKEILGRGF